jgi:hypothetical protein
LRRIVSHDSPAWNPSSASFSNSRTSSVTGRPHFVVVVGAVLEVVASAPPAPHDAVLVPDEAVRQAHRTTISIGSPASGTPPSSVTSQVSCM